MITTKNNQFFNNGCALDFIPENLKTLELCSDAINNNGIALGDVPVQYMTPEFCKIAVNNNAYALEYVPEHLKTVELCNLAYKKSKDTFQFIPYNFIDIEFSHKIIINNEDECPICMENDGAWCELDDCHHKVHLPCIKIVLKNPDARKCILCRKDIFCKVCKTI